MYKRVVRDFFILLGLFILWASTSRQAMGYISDKRDVNKWWGTYQMLNGDLVSMSYLDFVKKFNPGPDPTKLKRVEHKASDNTILFLDGDSYTWHVGDSNFSGVSSLVYINRDHGCNYHLDTSKRNVLVLEVSERLAWDYFSSLRIFDEVCDSAIRKKNIASGSSEIPRRIECASVSSISIDDFFNKYINQNLQCNLFNYQFMMPMFESKAAINYYVFNRASGDVVISNDRNFLFLKRTVSFIESGSSYVPIQAEQIRTLVDNFNRIYDHYKKSGFNEVYLSIIPNSSTIMQPEGYNNFIPLIQNDPALRMKLIDIYSVFKKSPEGLYLPGDTHWTIKGKQEWVNLVSEKLQTAPMK